MKELIDVIKQKVGALIAFHLPRGSVMTQKRCRSLGILAVLCVVAIIMRRKSKSSDLEDDFKLDAQIKTH